MIKSYISSPQSLISFIEHSKEYWWIKDCESRYMYMNKSGLNDLNVPKNFDIEGRLDRDIPIKPCQELWPEFVAYDKRVIDENRTILSVVVHYYGKGNTDKPMPVLAKKMPFYDDNNKIIGVIDNVQLIDSPTLLFYMHRFNRKIVQCDAPNDIFTKRELDIIFWAQQRLSSKEIAEQLNISPRTISNILQFIYKKAGVHSIGQLIEYCKHTGLDSYIPANFILNGLKIIE